MKSHTVPEKLLKQFAFKHPVKGLRLWRYQKIREPYWDVSPSKATVVEGQFSDLRNAEREESIETELNQRFENPVHDFIEQLGLRTFVFGANHMRSRARAYRWDKLRRTFPRTRTAVGFSGRSSPSAPTFVPPPMGQASRRRL